MGFELFHREEAALRKAAAILDSGVLGEGPARAHFAELLAAYDKLFRNARKLVRLSDRSEAELNAVAKALDEKSQMLQRLSQQLAKYLSPQVYDAIFSGRQVAELKTERKKLTVFFSDIKNFTATTADLQPEDLTALLNHYFTEMSRIAIRHGATIDKFIGDAMLMFFGDPDSRGVPDDARACVRMAVEMQQRMRELALSWQALGYHAPIEMRIGINTGYCNVGNFGSDERMDYTIIGGEVNLAARLEAAAEPGGILLSGETYALVQDLVQVEPRLTIEMKGIKRSVQAFAVTGLLDAEARQGRVLHHEAEGVYLHIDPDRLGDEASRQALAERLKTLLAQL